MFQMCHQTLQGTQCTGAQLYLWPVVQTKRKVTPLVSAAVKASPVEQMGVCSPSGPLPAVLHAPTALGGARGDVWVAALSSGRVKLHPVVSPAFPEPWIGNLIPISGHRSALVLHLDSSEIYVGNFFAIMDLQFKKHSDTHTGLQLFVKWLPASPGRPRVQLIPHAWAKYHLCLFGNKGGTC